MFGVQQHLDLVICEDDEDAIAKGFKYSEEYGRLQIDKVVIVQNGTEQGNSTVDLVMIDPQGKKSVVMITCRLLKSIPC